MLFTCLPSGLTGPAVPSADCCQGGLSKAECGVGGACSFICPFSPLLQLPHMLACDALEVCAAGVLSSGLVSGDPPQLSAVATSTASPLEQAPPLDQTPWNPWQPPGLSGSPPQVTVSMHASGAGAQRTTLRSAGSPRPTRWCLTSRCLFWTRSKCCSSSR